MVVVCGLARDITLNGLVMGGVDPEDAATANAQRERYPDLTAGSSMAL